jgi:hypothetical protein
MSEVESLLAERNAIEKDYVKLKSKLSDWTHDLFINRLDMIESMLEFEGYYA